MSDEKTYGGLTAYEIRHEHRFGCPHDRGIVIELLDERERLLKDAARYQWLKAYFIEPSAHWKRFYVVRDVRISERFDAEIDAALAAAEEE